MSSQEHEINERLKAIHEGPWSKALPKASAGLTAKQRSGKLDLKSIALTTAQKKVDARLSKTLRPHYLSKAGVTNEREIAVRDAYDDALTLPQLYELAVQTGYLPVERVAPVAQEKLIDLLWLPAVQNYVAAYDYVAVPMLANRVGVSGLEKVKPPEPNKKSELRFAAFLAHLRAFYEDENIQAWLAFLDDFQEEADEQNKLWEYLRGERSKGPRRKAELLIGCQQFVTSLASAFQVLDDDELGRFGLMHAYWLQKFFAYEVGPNGYVKDDDLWDRGDSWAKTISRSKHVLPTDVDPELGTSLRQALNREIALLEKTFKAVRELVGQTRKQAKRVRRR